MDEFEPKVIFVNRYFYPDQSATSQLLHELVSDLSVRGLRICVVSSRQEFENPLASLKKYEAVDGVAIYRVASTSFGRSRLVGRACDYASFYFTSAIQLLKLVSEGDVVVAKTDPPLISVVVAVVCRLKRATQVNWLQDVFPEIAIILGIASLSGTKGRLVQAVRNWSLMNAATNVVIGRNMATRVRAATRGRIDEPVVIQNWTDTTAIRPTQSVLLRKQWNLSDHFVVGYSGNMGRVHEFETILGAMSRFDKTERIRFLFVGGGNQLAWLRRETQSRGVQELAEFQPYQPRELLNEVLAVPDVHLVSLRSELEGLVVPSKFYNIAAAARPTIFIGDPDGEIAKHLSDFSCGLTVPPGDAAALASTIRRFAGDVQLSNLYGANARDAAVTRFDRSVSSGLWLRILRKALPQAHPSRR